MARHEKHAAQVAKAAKKYRSKERDQMNEIKQLLGLDILPQTAIKNAYEQGGVDMLRKMLEEWTDRLN